MGTVHEDVCTFKQYLVEFFLWREMSQAKVVEKIKTHILCAIETPGKFWNVVLEKDGEDQLDRSCE